MATSAYTAVVSNFPPRARTLPSGPSYGVSPLMATVTQMQIAHLIREGRLTNRALACPT